MLEWCGELLFERKRRYSKKLVVGPVLDSEAVILRSVVRHGSEIVFEKFS